MSGTALKSSTAQPVEKFLEKIFHERDATIARIRADAHAARSALRRQARRESRRVFRTAAMRARSDALLERQRLVSAVQARIRREQWQVLREWVGRGVDSVMAELRARWEDRDRQGEWAEFWLRAALDQAGDQALHVDCGALTNEITRQRIEKLLGEHPAGGVLRSPAGLDCGLQVTWGALSLDGTLMAQRETVENALLARFSRLCHEFCQGSA